MSSERIWAGGEHAFDLKIEHLRALQTKCDAGPEWIMRRLIGPHWLVDDVVETIRLGLIGGGIDQEKARALVDKHLVANPRNLKAAAIVAASVLLDAISTDEGDAPGEAGAGEGLSQNLSREESGGSPDSTDGPASLDATSAE